MIRRRKTRQIKVGSIRIGGGAPIAVQSMTKFKTANIKKTASQIKDLEEAGCEIVRVAVKDFDDAKAIKGIKKKIKIPLVSDIHFDYRLALAAIASGADKIRINPGNIREKFDIAAVAKSAKKAKIPIRIGVNSGSLFTRDACPPKSEGRRREGRRTRDDRDIATRLVNSALLYIKLFEQMGFRDIIISLKASDVVTTVEAYRKIAELCDYPLHLGVTAAGPYDTGIVKSAIGIGALLLDGIGDTIRVSLTADPVEEVIAAKRILSALNIRRFGPEIISCPTCGRCQVDLVSIVRELERKLLVVSCQLSERKPLTIAVMGCEVNGPGEAREADIGVAFGKDSGMLFKKGKVLKKVSIKNAVKELLKYF